MDRLGRPSRRERARRLLLPVVALPAYLGDLGRAVALGNAAERRTRLDRLQLLGVANHHDLRSEEHTSELQSLMRISYAVFCLKKKNMKNNNAEGTIKTADHKS